MADERMLSSVGRGRISSPLTGNGFKRADSTVNMSADFGYYFRTSTDIGLHDLGREVPLQLQESTGNTVNLDDGTKQTQDGAYVMG